MKKRVAVILHGLGANGIDTLFANLSKEWNYDKFEVVYLLAVDEGAHQFWEDEVVVNGIQVVHLHDLDKRRLFKWPISLRNALKKYGPFDAVHMNMDMLNGINLVVARSVGIPVRVCHAHRSSSENASNYVKRLYVSLMKRIIKENGTDFVACSDKAGEYFFGNIPFKIIFNGINIKKYQKKIIELNYIRGGVRFVSVGRFSPPKRPFFLLDVFEQIVERVPQAHLTWVGDGTLFDGVCKVATEKGITDKIDFLGTRSDVNEILKQSDYFLLPSEFEGLSLALAEAQAAGLDCFVTDTVSRMSDCGKCMFIPYELTANEWADEIIGYIHGNKKMLIDEKSLERFNIEKMARELEEIYDG